MMTTEAFNALLKTLEEPPEHVIFILATTEPHKILPTILSRCQRYDFTKVSDSDIKERLKVVLEKEGVSYNEEAVDTIISLADGGMRDALSILDQVLAYSGNILRTEDILSIFALESKEEKISLIKDIAQGQVGEVLSKLSNYIQKGTDVKRLTNDLLVILKDVLIYSLTGRKDLFQFIDASNASDLANYLTTDRIVEMIDILLNAMKEYKNVNDINPLFEVTLLKLASTKNKASQPVQNKMVEEEEIVIKPAKPVQNTPKVEEKPKIVEPVKVEEPAPEIAPEVITSNKALVYTSALVGDHFELNEEALIGMFSCSRKDMKNKLMENWPDIKKLMNHPTIGKYASLLVDSYPLVASNKFLVVVYQLNSMVEKSNLLANQAGIENVIETISGKRLFIYAVSRSDSVDLQKKYMNLYSIGKLPKTSEDDYEFSEEEIQ